MRVSASAMILGVIWAAPVNAQPPRETGGSWVEIGLDAAMLRVEGVRGVRSECLVIGQWSPSGHRWLALGGGLGAVVLRLKDSNQRARRLGFSPFRLWIAAVPVRERGWTWELRVLGTIGFDAFGVDRLAANGPPGSLGLESSLEWEGSWVRVAWRSDLTLVWERFAMPVAGFAWEAALLRPSRTLVPYVRFQVRFARDLRAALRNEVGLLWANREDRALWLSLQVGTPRDPEGFSFGGSVGVRWL